MTASIQVPHLLAPARSFRCTGTARHRRPEALPAGMNSGVVAESKTVRRTSVFNNTQGLHCRTASLLVRALGDFAFAITADNDGCVVDARSVLGLLSLEAGSGSRLRFEASGKKATEAVQAVERLFRSNFAEAYSFHDL